jgi:serine/threonine protein kinase
MDNLCGRTLGKYDVAEVLGQGSMGMVYLAHDPFIGRDVAIKVAHPEALEGAESAARYRKLFFNEAKVAGMLRHPNIVSVFDAGIEHEIWYIVMEYVEGGATIHAHCSPHGLLPLEDVVRIIFKTARALDFAHRKGIVHRDVKPKNVLLTSEQDVKLSDFGVALLTHIDATDTQVDGVVGSPLYMAPELLREENATNQSDVFSMGVMMYELLTGKQPFAADNLPSIIYNITERPHRRLRELRYDVPAILEHIVDRCLSKVLCERYKSCLDVAADLSLVFDQMKLSQEELSGRVKFDRVKDLSFFREFPESEIWEVINASAWHGYDTDEEIIQEGDVEISFFIIVEGRVSVRKGSRDLDMLARGDCFGEMGFIAGSKRTATIVAKTEVAALKITSSLIEKASLSCQLRFKNVFLETMVRRLSLADDVIVDK